MVTHTDAARRRPPTRKGRGPSSITLTGRGAIVMIAVATLFGAIIDAPFGTHSAQGVFFCVGCVVAAAGTRKGDLLVVAVGPAVVFFAVTAFDGVLSGLGSKSFLLGVAVSIATTLADGAPWLFAGVVLAALITIRRGVLRAFRELRAQVVEDNPFRRGNREDPVRWDEEMDDSDPASRPGAA